MITVNGLSKKIKDINILDNISFELSKSSIVGLLGRNGAGKTTLIEILSNLQKPTTGNVYLKNIRVQQWKDIYKNIGVCIEPRMPEYLTVYEYLKQVSILRKESPFNIDKTLQILDLDRQSKVKIKNLSFGLTQRVGIASAILGDPDILLLDEPFVGLDPIGIKKLAKHLTERRDNGATILVSSHQLSDIETLIDSLIYIDNGCIVENIKTEEILEHSILLLKTSNNTLAKNILSKKFGIDKIFKERELLKLRIKNSFYNDIVEELNRSEIDVIYEELIPMNLEHFFMDGVINDK